jgi:hypothetical protein
VLRVIEISTQSHVQPKAAKVVSYDCRKSRTVSAYHVWNPIGYGIDVPTIGTNHGTFVYMNLKVEVALA